MSVTLACDRCDFLYDDVPAMNCAGPAYEVVEMPDRWERHDGQHLCPSCSAEFHGDFMKPKTSNEQIVGVQGENIIVMRVKFKMTKEEALVHAAWLVALAGGRDAFLPILDRVEAS